jgi:hypothetical protein
MKDEPKKLTHKELRRLRPGDWVAWGKSNWNKTVKRIRPSNPWSMASPDSAGFSFGPAKRWVGICQTG